MKTNQGDGNLTSLYRVYVEKRPGFTIEAEKILKEIKAWSAPDAPDLAKIQALRIVNRYDVEGLDETAFKNACGKVFADPVSDVFYLGPEVPGLTGKKGEYVLASEFLPGQYDQRQDFAAQCLELLAPANADLQSRPRVRCAKIYVFTFAQNPSEAAKKVISQILINPVDARQASLAMPANLDFPGGQAGSIPVLEGFINLNDSRAAAFLAEWGLGMSEDDLLLCRDHFKKEGRDPSLAEMRVLDTYWSDHCRHSTFLTELQGIDIEDGPGAGEVRRAVELWEAAREEVYGAEKASERPHSLMDLATIAAKLMRKRGKLEDEEVSGEVNACSVRVKAEFDDGTTEPWLFMFKNETHNHPTEIEPFGGASTCLGGGIRDPLSGRSLVYQAMRIVGAGDPRQAEHETLPGKLPQIKLARDASRGYASYGNQIGATTGQVTEVYHPGFLAKRMEMGALVVRREEPAAGDVVILVGAETGRDGVGGATGSSREHTDESAQKAGAEVQKGNPAEERKIQRLFRRKELTRLIKRCNDFGAGGVSVAVGELARGLLINLDKVTVKYPGLDGMELAISESQERMAVVVQAKDAPAFIAFSREENLDAHIVATVTKEERLKMTWQGRTIIDLDRAFLDLNGATRYAKARILANDNCTCSSCNCQGTPEKVRQPVAFADALEAELASLRTASRRGVQEMFDGSAGKNVVHFPFGGKTQGSPEIGMAALLPSLDKNSKSASVMSFGWRPDIAEKSPFLGGRAAVLESLAKYICIGGELSRARLSFQEYFESTSSMEAWGKPLAALLGALEAQIELETPAIGGKDSMSGTYRDPSNGHIINVPPTLISIAAGVTQVDRISSATLSGKTDSILVLFAVSQKDIWKSFKANAATLEALRRGGFVRAATALSAAGPASALTLMAFGNNTSLELDIGFLEQSYTAGSFILELDPQAITSCLDNLEDGLKDCISWEVIGRTLPKNGLGLQTATLTIFNSALKDIDGREESVSIPLARFRQAWEGSLTSVYPQFSGGQSLTDVEVNRKNHAIPLAKEWHTGHTLEKPRTKKQPQVLIPVFPGSHGEWDVEKSFVAAGARVKSSVFYNKSPGHLEESFKKLAEDISRADILVIPNGAVAGNEPEGGAKFMVNVLREERIARAIEDLLEKRNGLVLGLGNGFQALVKLGVFKDGKISELQAGDISIMSNPVGRYVSRMVHTKIMSNKSPWLSLDAVGAIYTLPVSSEEGALVLSPEQASSLFAAGQIAACYCDEDGEPNTSEIWNPLGSAFAVEALLSPCGRIFGKMALSERIGPDTFKNIPGVREQRLFEAAVQWFN